MNSLTNKIKNLKSWLIDVRRDLHKTPELGLEEFLTKEKIIKLMAKANECMSSSDKKALVKKYKLEGIPQIKEFIEKSDFYKEVDTNLIAQNILEK